MNDDTAAWSRFVTRKDGQRGRHVAFWSELHVAEEGRRLIGGMVLMVGSAVGLVAAGLAAAWGLS